MFTYVKHVKEVTLKILNGRMYITRSVTTRFFPWIWLPRYNGVAV